MFWDAHINHRKNIKDYKSKHGVLLFENTFSFCVFPLPYFLIGVVIPSSRGLGAEAQQLCTKKFLKLWTLELSKGGCILNWSYLVHDFFFLLLWAILFNILSLLW